MRESEEGFLVAQGERRARPWRGTEKAHPLLGMTTFGKGAQSAHTQILTMVKAKAR